MSALPSTHAPTRPAPQPRPPAVSRLRPARPTAGRWALFGLLALVAANWLLWASAVPYGEAPDEPSHVEVTQFLAAHGRLPVFGPAADVYVRLDQVGIPIEPHALAPPLTYYVDGALLRLLPLAPPVAARLGSLLAALVAVALTYAFVRGLLPGHPALALSVAALLAAVPQFSFLAATANSDVFALTATLVVACLRRKVGQPLGALAFGLALGCALLAKYTAYPAAGAAVLAAAWQLWMTAVPANRTSPHRAPGLVIQPPRDECPPALPWNQTRTPGVAWAAWRAALVGGGALLVVGPWLLHNLQAYGRLWPLGVTDAALRVLTPTVAVAGTSATHLPWDPDYWQSWWVITFRSFWAGFDRVSLFAPDGVYVALAVACLVGAAGLVRAVAAPPTRAGAVAWLRQPTGLFLLLWPAATLLATVLLSFGRYYPVHGRYLIVLLPLVALALAAGWRALAPARWATAAAWLPVGGMMALNAYCLLGVVVPHYYGPTATRVALTVDEPRPGDLTTPDVAIRGWAVVTGRPAWEPGRVGGAPPWQRPAASIGVTLDGEPIPSLAGAGGVERPDVARALGPAAADTGFAYQWDTRGAPPGVHVLTLCAADPTAPEPTCVPLPVRVPQH